MGPRLVPVSSLVALVSLAGCTTDLDLLVADGVDEAGVSNGPDATIDDFPPPTMEPTFQDPDPIVDPPGPFAFTLVHGVVDAPTIFLCWARNGEAQGNPWPEQGMAFGDAWVSEELPDLDLAADDLELVVIAANPGMIAGLDCGDVLNDPRSGVLLGAPISALTRSIGSNLALALSDAGVTDSGLSDAGSLVDAGGGDPGTTDSGTGSPGTGGSLDAAVVQDASSPANGGDAAATDSGIEPLPEIRVAYLPIIPAGTLSTQGSYLLTVAGCVGGFSSQDERALCGGSYSPKRPTLTPLLVRLSRLVTFGNPSLQFLQGSLGAGTTTLLSVPSLLSGGTQVTIATDVPPGVIEPYPPVQTVAPSTFGAPLSAVSLQLESQVGASWSETWGNALGSLNIEALEGLTGYTLVFIGPNPWLQSDDEHPWWNEPRFVMVRNSPE